MDTPPDSAYRSHFYQLAKQMNLEHLSHRFSEDTVLSDGIRLHLDIIISDRNAPTVVFLPGTATYALCFAEILVAIADAGYNVVGIDARGHGRSEGTRGDYTVSELVRDAQAVIGYAIDHFNERVSLLGCSQGGIIAFYTAAIDDRIQSAICQNFADLSDPATLHIARYPTLARWSKPLMAAANRLFPKQQIPITTYIDHKRLKIPKYGTIQDFVEQDPLAIKTISVRALWSLSNTRLGRPIEQINIPLMILQPGNDEIFPLAYTQHLFDQLTCQKQLCVLPDMTHTMMVAAPQIAVKPIIEWLNGLYVNGE